MDYKYYNTKSDQLNLQKWTDKASYLEWVKEWKSLYKELTIDIREIRCELSKPHNLSIINGWFAPGSAPDLQYKKQLLRVVANCMMEIRKTGKEESWKHKQSMKTEA